MSNEDAFARWFQHATGYEPYPFQIRFACDPCLFQHPAPPEGDGLTGSPLPTEGEGKGEGARSDAGLLVDVPTGMGKTAMAVLGWLWRRRFHPDEAVRKATPRRLVYCLPMRVLVEQTVSEAKKWIAKLQEHYPQEMAPSINVYVLMGGEIDNDWDAYPEADAILVGTQDQLLSRALNRGYGIGRGRWPMHFALLNNDCLWVMDEVQLMDTGLATSAQLWAFRRRWTPQPGSPTALITDSGVEPKEITPAIFGNTTTVWMSATLQKSWLQTVDVKNHPIGETLTLSDEDKERAADRWNAKKVIRPASPNDESMVDSKKRKQRKAPASKFPSPNHDLAAYARTVADFVADKHKNQRQLTLVVLNTVERAMQVFEALQEKTQAECRILHSRFRPHERKQWDSILNRTACEAKNLPQHGRIIIATQVVEAGVDISAKLLITELAPWPSLVQRFGRCHRYGEFKDDGGGELYWIDIPDEEAAPYDPEALKQAREQLKQLSGRSVSPEALDEYLKGLTADKRAKLFPYDPEYVLRDKDLQELFDTTPDLTGADIDVSRYIRSGRDLDVQVFWRDVPATGPGTDKTWKPHRQELCPVPCWGDHGFQAFIKAHKKVRAWRWDYLDGQWVSLYDKDSERIYPGQIFLLDVTSGGYDEQTPRGWTGDPDDRPQPVPAVAGRTGSALTDDGNDDQEDNDDRSKREWKTLTVHCWEAAQEYKGKIGPMLDNMVGKNEQQVITLGLRLHDWGKVHEVFQGAIQGNGRPSGYENRRDLAKAPKECWEKGYRRTGFRHELASALAILETVRRARPDHPALVSPEVREMLQAAGFWSNADESVEGERNQNHNAVIRELVALSAEDLDLLVCLVAGHHGKVRLSLRASPKDYEENADDPVPSGVRQARGVRDQDPLPGVSMPDAQGNGILMDSVKLNLAVMELGLNATYGPSWSERMQALRDKWGPFKLAYLEALVRAADWRASA